MLYRCILPATPGDVKLIYCNYYEILLIYIFYFTLTLIKVGAIIGPFPGTIIGLPL